MKYLGIDFGSRKLGLAVSDSAEQIAFPKAEVPNDEKVFDALLKVIEEERIGGVVIGDTRAINGGENPITADADEFAEALAAKGVKVERVWEAFSTVEAARFAPKGQEHNDAAAAAIILQRFLDMKTKS